MSLLISSSSLPGGGETRQRLETRGCRGHSLSQEQLGNKGPPPSTIVCSIKGDDGEGGADFDNEEALRRIVIEAGLMGFVGS